MKQKFILIILAGLMMFPAFAQHPSQDKNWEVIFSDDFGSFNTNLWQKRHNEVSGSYDYYDPGKRNECPHVYIQDNVYIENGKLVLRVKEQTYPCPKGQGFLNCQYGGTHDYTSGSVWSKKTYKYGYFEVYAKLPASSGYWPAFWLWNAKGSPDCWYNEIDVIETYGNEPNIVESNSWWKFECPLDPLISLGVIKHTCNYSTGYHWYGVEWNADKIIWYVDRQKVREIVNDKEGIGIQNPMFIILNIALAPIWMVDNLITPNTIFPNYMYIDTANAYRLKCDKNTVVTQIPNFNTYNYAVKKSISLSSTTTIPANSNISLRATDFIELQPGFSVDTGRELYLDVNPCDNTARVKKQD